jgi:hypothetical protein
MNIYRYIAVTAIQTNFLLAELNLEKHVLPTFRACNLEIVHGACWWWIIRCHTVNCVMGLGFVATKKEENFCRLAEIGPRETKLHR